jgi:hypothetical protein
MAMVSIKGCAMANCAYNKDNKCRTPAITVGPHAECNTFVHASPKAGMDGVKPGIGACQASSCRFNDMLECHAPAISVSSDERHADCETYDPKDTRSRSASRSAVS